MLLPEVQQTFIASVPNPAIDCHRMAEPPLLQRIAAEDRDAMEQCVDRFGPLIWSAAHRYLGRSHEAEDAVQEVFVELWQSAHRYDESLGSETTFVMVLARRRLLDCRRRLVRRPEMTPLEEVDEPPMAAATAPSNGSDDDGFHAVQALRTLPPEQQQVIELSIREGRTHQEIASRLAMPLGTVKTLLRRGLLRLRSVLERGKPEVLK